MSNPYFPGRNTLGEKRKLDKLDYPHPPPLVHPSLDDPRADIVLRSSDRALFKLRRVHLIAASSIFDDMLSSPELGTVGEKIGGLAVVDLSETSRELSAFLSILLPIRDGGKEVTATNILSLINLSQKYDTPGVIGSIMIFLRAALAPNAALVFVCAVIIEDEPLSKKAMEAFRTPHPEAGSSRRSFITSDPLSLLSSSCRSISHDLLERIPSYVLLQYTASVAAVASGLWSWEEEAGRFTLSRKDRRHALA